MNRCCNFDDKANEACRTNNKEVVAKGGTPVVGGNIEKFRSIVSSSQSFDGAKEFTFVKYDDPSGSAVKFVILVTALMYEQDQKSVPILDP